nr:NADH:flavin oxidoreductase [Amycolatopsis sp.]
MNTLFDKVELGPLTLPNRIVMAPMGRCRVGRDGTPTDSLVTYYAQRASAGLIISESTHPSLLSQGHAHCARIDTPEQVAGWRRVTDAVHAEGGRMFLQILHVGRISHPDIHGQVPVAPSPVQADGLAMTYSGRRPFPPPRALTVPEIDRTIAEYAAAARKAVQAGFDGVELHGANGYLPHQFLSTHTNHRTDEYGGSVRNRIRFTERMVAAVAAEIGPERIGIRLSPGGRINDMREDDVDDVYPELTRILAGLGIAYLHLVVGTDQVLARRLRAEWPGAMILNPGTGGLGVPETLDIVDQHLRDGFDLFSFAKQFLANPDLPERLRTGAELNRPDIETFYTGGDRGFIDYPALAKHR